MKKSILLGLITTIVIGFTSCIGGDNKNEATYSGIAVVRYLSGTESASEMVYLDTEVGRFAAPELKNKGLSYDDCLALSTTISYDTKTGDYATLTGTQYKKEKKVYADDIDADSEEDAMAKIDELSVDSITFAALQFSGYSSPLIDRNLFLGVKMLTQGQEPQFKLVYSPLLFKKVAENRVYPVFYLCAENVKVTGIGFKENPYFFASNVRDIVPEYVANNLFSCYIRYKSGIDKDGKNVYKNIPVNGSLLDLYDLNYDK